MTVSAPLTKSLRELEAWWNLLRTVVLSKVVEKTLLNFMQKVIYIIPDRSYHTMASQDYHTWSQTIWSDSQL